MKVEIPASLQYNARNEQVLKIASNINGKNRRIPKLIQTKNNTTILEITSMD